MPRPSKKELNIKLPSLEDYQDHEEIFYCETTKEIFRDYDEYFARIMIINSTIWCCEATGRENLTYEEALKSEKKAVEKGNGLREVIKAPALLLAKIAQQSSHKELSRLQYGFFREQYLIGEKVMLANHPDSAQRHEYEVVDVIRSKDAKETDLKVSSLKYKLKRINDPETIIVESDKIRRLKTDYSFDRLTCFLKENTKVIDGIIYPKENVYKKYVTDKNITFQNLFVGELPQWKAKKRRSEIEKTKRDNEKKKKVPEKENNVIEKKQKTVSQYLLKQNGELDNTNKKKVNLKDEMERIRMEREAKEREIEKKRIELDTKAELEVTKVLSKCDDLERYDQKMLPTFKPVKSIIPQQQFGDLLMIQEFVHSFGPKLAGNNAGIINFHQMCRAFTVREVAGPLSDLIQLLLSIIFDLQYEEDQKCKIEYRKSIEAKTEPQISINRANNTHHFVSKHYSFKVYELPIDPLTVSEVLRLHLLSSGAATSDKCTRWRGMYRNGYSNTEDPGLIFQVKQPHILRTLKCYSIYQLPMTDIIKITKCLIDQILTYQETLTILEERAEKQAKLQQEIRNLYAAENKRIALITNKKRDVTNQYNLKIMETTNPEEKQKLLHELNSKIEKINADDEREKKEFEYQISEMRGEIFDYMINFGSDRCYRQYLLLESICGLFIEHPHSMMIQKCRENPPQNLTELSNLPHNRPKLKQFFLKHFEEMEKENSKQYKLNTEANKENTSNSENLRINGLPNNTNSSPENVKIVEYGPWPYNPSQYELYMCTGDPNECIVHNEKDRNRCQWSFINTHDELEALIDSLNPLGKREGPLREQLITYKSLILEHIENCPVKELSFEDNSEMEKFMNKIKSDRKYLNSNFGVAPGIDVGDILYSKLLDRILTFERDITFGHLGKLKVKDIERWRLDLQNNSYDSQCKNLTYGPEGDIVEFKEPGEGLGNTTEIISDESSDEEIPLHESAELYKLIHNLASALLQIEQAIDQQFLKHPYGLKAEVKDKEINEIRLAEGRSKLKNWELSLMKSTNFAQVFLHLNILYDAVKWTKSSNLARCMKCRKKNEPEQMLLCDECNSGMHTFCMQPRIKAIPEGNWYCKRCTEKLGLEKKKAENKKRKAEIEYKDESEEDSDEEDANEENSSEELTEPESEVEKMPRRETRGSTRNKRMKYGVGDNSSETKEDDSSVRVKVNGKNKGNNVEYMYTSDSSETDEDNDEGDTCKVCGFKGTDVFCGSCDDSYHSECVGLRRLPRGGWECSKCKDTREKPTKRKAEGSSETQSEEISMSEDSNEPFRKHSRRMSEARSSKRQGENNLNGRDQRNAPRRSRRHEGYLPLNSVILYNLLECIIKHKDAWPFLRPVMASQVPDYLNVIKKPMDFGLIKSKLNMGEYRENQEVLNDIELVFRNCDLYNTAENDIYRAGKSLERFVYQKCKDLKLSFNPSDMISNELNE